GLARAEGAEDLTASGDVVGTLRYLAPERFRGWADPRSDVYGLGATLYELLTLSPAFPDFDRARLVARGLHEAAPPPRPPGPRAPRRRGGRCGRGRGPGTPAPATGRGRRWRGPCAASPPPGGGSPAAARRWSAAGAGAGGTRGWRAWPRRQLPRCCSGPSSPWA